VIFLCLLGKQMKWFDIDKTYGAVISTIIFIIVGYVWDKFIKNRRNKMENGKKIFVNGSFLIVESIARAGADTFVGYPITPSNYLYLYSSKRLPLTFHAPDEITTLQWMSGLSAAGRLPITATSFPGFALMVESINMAFMMELPMVIILAQRLGPSTGTATCGASGDLLLVRGMISGGYPVPTFAISDFKDCWEIPEIAINTAVNLRTPVIIFNLKRDHDDKQKF